MESYLRKCRSSSAEGRLFEVEMLLCRESQEDCGFLFILVCIDQYEGSEEDDFLSMYIPHQFSIELHKDPQLFLDPERNMETEADLERVAMDLYRNDDVKIGRVRMEELGRGSAMERSGMGCSS